MFSYKVPDRAILLEIKQYHLNTAWNIVCVCVCVYIYIYIYALNLILSILCNKKENQ